MNFYFMIEIFTGLNYSVVTFDHAASRLRFIYDKISTSMT